MFWMQRNIPAVLKMDARSVIIPFAVTCSQGAGDVQHEGQQGDRLLWCRDSRGIGPSPRHPLSVVSEQLAAVIYGRSNVLLLWSFFFNDVRIICCEDQLLSITFHPGAPAPRHPRRKDRCLPALSVMAPCSPLQLPVSNSCRFTGENSTAVRYFISLQHAAAGCVTCFLLLVCSATRYSFLYFKKTTKN